MASNAQLQWVRPDSVPFPIVWRTFEAKESKDSDQLVKYIIQDLPEDRFEDAIPHMTEYYMVDHPLAQATNGVFDKDFVEDFKRVRRAVLKQKCSLVCFREGSDEIIGLSVQIINTENDTFGREISKLCKSKGYSDAMKTADILYANFSPYEKYNVNQYLGSYGSSVHPKYRGCGIGTRILETRKTMGTAFALKLTHARFASEQASRIADRVGFKLDLECSIDELIKIDPSLPYTNERTNKIALKTWIF